eukprot:362288-Chlamydomonas_euryale.AAC.2
MEVWTCGRARASGRGRGSRDPAGRAKGSGDGGVDVWTRVPREGAEEAGNLPGGPKGLVMEVWTYGHARAWERGRGRWGSF